MRRGVCAVEVSLVNNPAAFDDQQGIRIRIFKDILCPMPNPVEFITEVQIHGSLRQRPLGLGLIDASGIEHQLDGTVGQATKKGHRTCVDDNSRPSSTFLPARQPLQSHNQDKANSGLWGDVMQNRSCFSQSLKTWTDALFLVKIRRHCM